MNIKEAYSKIRNYETSLFINENDINTGIEFKVYLEKLKKIAEIHPNYVISNDFERIIENFKSKDSKEVEKLGEEIINIKNKMDEKGELNEDTFFEKNRIGRKRCLIIFLIIITLIAIGGSIIAIWGAINEVNWANTLATCLGVIDFSIGVLGFSWERISDMKAQKVSREMNELRKINKEDFARSIEQIKNSTIGNNSPNFSRTKVKNGNINVPYNSYKKPNEDIVTNEEKKNE